MAISQQGNLSSGLMFYDVTLDSQQALENLRCSPFWCACSLSFQDSAYTPAVWYTP